MATEVLTGYFAKNEDFTLYANNTGQNVRVIFNYLSLEGTGTSEVRIVTPAQTNQTPSYDNAGNAIVTETVVPASYVQIPNIPDIDTDWMEGIVGKQLSSTSFNYSWYWGRWRNFPSLWWNNAVSARPGNNGYMFIYSSEVVTGSSYYFFGSSDNWWRKNNRIMEVPFPVELYLKPNQSLQFLTRKKTSKTDRKNTTISPTVQQITYNVLVMPEGGC
jgi:hypothetical protein